MNLTCKINGIEYPIVQGNTFADEYNETLDSGSVIIAHVKKIKKLKPFDDVFVYDSNFNFGGYSYGTDDLKPGDVVDTNGNKKLDNIFFKHLLVDNYTEEFVNLKDKTYKYKISLMSETKGLEKIQCPNISVTQPLTPDKKVSIYTYLQRFVSMYSPKFKKVRNDKTKTWVYTPKYKVDESLEKIFGNVYPPDFSLNAPTLRDILSKLMVCKDMIPYVENGVIKAMDITQRKNEFSLDDIPTTNIVGSMSSNDYCDALRRNYSEGLSQDSTCESVEYLGFRNSDSPLMTLQNMRLETRFPIYKINKLYMCYYKELNLIKKDKNDSSQTKMYAFLCKQDITPLIKLNTERNALSQDWDKFSKVLPLTIEGLSQYKLATLGYDIGSNHITGWGESYSYPKGWWRTEKKTYIENILYAVDKINPTGIYSYDSLVNKIKDYEGNSSDDNITYKFESRGDVFTTIITPFTDKKKLVEVIDEIPDISFIDEKLETIIQVLDVKSALDMKGLFFEIDYQGFFNGSVVVSKDNGLDNIVSNDNSSSSLALLEYDGLSQKEKVNRLGNKTYQFTVRYDNYGNDLSFLQNVGDYFKHDEEEDIIIYHREYSIYDTYVIATYFAAKDYVLKNYYTSVYARHRTWNLMSYGESVHRAENKKKFLVLSKEQCSFENENNIRFINFDNLYKSLISCFEPDAKKTNAENRLAKKDKVNYGYITINGQNYLTDVNSFLAGYSLCFNLKMVDNISMGSYISNPSPFYEKKYDDKKWEEHDRNWFDAKQDYTGSNTSLYLTIDDSETGFVEKISFWIGNYDTTYNYGSEILSNEYYAPASIDKGKGFIDIINKYENDLFILPKISSEINLQNKIGNEFYLYKDNKEYIDMTYQIEPITNDKNVLFSQWFMKLNDLLDNFEKTEVKYEDDNVLEDLKLDSPTVYFYATSSPTGINYQSPFPILFMAIYGTGDNWKMLNNLIAGKRISFQFKTEEKEIKWENNKDKESSGDYQYYINSLVWKPKNITIFFQYNKNDEIGNMDYWNDFIELEVEQKIKITEKIYNQELLKNEYITKEYITTELITLRSVDTKIYSEGYEELDNSFVWYKFDFGLSNEGVSEDITQWPNDKKVKVSTINLTIDDITTQFYRDDTKTEINISNGMSLIPNGLGLSADEVKKYDVTFYEENKPVTTYYKNMFVVTSREPLRNTLVYDEYKESQMDSTLFIENDIPVSDIFSIQKDSNGCPYIDVKLTRFPKNSGIKSIQYWYKDIVNNDPDNSLMKFVFGVNLTDEDLERGYVRVYASLVSNRDTRVYDQNHNVVGEVVNYLDENNEKPYGQNQYYMVK